MEGNAAAKDRCPLSVNPYEFETWQRTAWLAGWIDTHERGFHTENEAGSPGDPKYQLARCKAPTEVRVFPVTTGCCLRANLSTVQ